jgi:hypothetical protein
MSLKSDYKNDIFPGQRKYLMVQNEDGTVSFSDATQYSQQGDAFGANDINGTNAAINQLADAPTNTLKGRKTEGEGSVENLTPAEARLLLNVEDGANNYSHPTGDGNSHVPATGDANNGKVLMAGEAANSASWQALGVGDVSGAAPSASPTFTGTPKATPKTDYTTAQLRNVIASTVDLVAGASELASGTLYVVYE